LGRGEPLSLELGWNSQLRLLTQLLRLLLESLNLWRGAGPEGGEGRGAVLLLALLDGLETELELRSGLLLESLGRNRSGLAELLNGSGSRLADLLNRSRSSGRSSGRNSGRSRCRGGRSRSLPLGERNRLREGVRSERSTGGLGLTGLLLSRTNLEGVGVEGGVEGGGGGLRTGGRGTLLVEGLEHKEGVGGWGA